KADNLAVVVTHEALGIAELFGKFRIGEESAPIEEEEDEEQEEVRRHRLLTEDYQAGDQVLHLNSTNNLEKGDQVTVKFFNTDGKEQRHYFVIEDVIGNGKLQVTPLEVDIPKDTPARKSPTSERIFTQFKGHVGLEWYLLIDGEYISIAEFREREALRRKGLAKDAEGEIITSRGQRLKDLAPEFYQLAIEGLQVEEQKIDIPYQQLVSFRPDEEKKDRQQYYRKQINQAINGILFDKILVPDGSKGRSLIEQSLKSLNFPSEKKEPKNSDILFNGIFGHVKRVTGKQWGEHQTEEEYEAAKNIAIEKLQEVREELKKRQGH
ncbi:MAG: hypothetical protein AB1589_21570, partial [Cyanobacteriota bacterium]